MTRVDRPGFDEARAIVARAAPVPRAEPIPLADAIGRITAIEIDAARDYPAFDASAMDGFAYPARATAGATADTPIFLPIAGESRAGGVVPLLPDGSAAAINTGAMMPPGCDTVVPRERATIVDRAGQRSLRIDAPDHAGRNVRKRGEDVRTGDLVLPPDTIVSAEMIGALACFGLTDVPVFAAPRIAIVPTGDELVEKDALSSIVDSNGPMIAAAVTALGLPVTHHAPVADCRRSIENAVQAILLARSADIVISTGGVSAGDHDHVSAALRAMGATIHFHGVRMRPGKPVLFASFDDGPLFFGLPGNPVAALVGFRFLVMAAIRATMGRPLEEGERISVATPARSGTTILLKARQPSAGGSPDDIEILAGQQSHMMRPLLTANRWLAVDETVPGTMEVRSFPIAATLA